MHTYSANPILKPNWEQYKDRKEDSIKRDKQRQTTYRGNIEIMYSSLAHTHTLSQPNPITKEKVSDIKIGEH